MSLQRGPWRREKGHAETRGEVHIIDHVKCAPAATPRRGISPRRLGGGAGVRPWTPAHPPHAGGACSAVRLSLAANRRPRAPTHARAAVPSRGRPARNSPDLACAPPCSLCVSPVRVAARPYQLDSWASARPVGETAWQQRVTAPAAAREIVRSRRPGTRCTRPAVTSVFARKTDLLAFTWRPSCLAKRPLALRPRLATGLPLSVALVGNANVHVRNVHTPILDECTSAPRSPLRSFVHVCARSLRVRATGN